MSIASPPLIKIDTEAHVIFGIENARRETRSAGNSRAVRRRFINVNGLISPRDSRRNSLERAGRYPHIRGMRTGSIERTSIVEIKNAARLTVPGWTMPCIIYSFIFVRSATIRPSIHDKRMMDERTINRRGKVFIRYTAYYR